MKEKLVIISSFCNISEYEPYSIQMMQMMYLFLNISIIIFINAFLFSEQYMTRRLLAKGNLTFVYGLKHELDRSSLTGFVSAVTLYLITLFFTLRKKIKYLKYTKKSKESFLIEAGKYIQSYRRRNFISIVVCFLLMVIILFYLTVFIEVYPSIFIILIEDSLISLCFCILFQIVILFIISWFRKIGKSWYVPFFYNLSRVLI